MNDLERDALLVSAVLDDKTEGTLEDRFAGQRRVHAGLSAPGAAPNEPCDIRARVMMRVGTPAPAPRRSWPLAAAASLTLLAGIGWVVVKSLQPAPVVAPRVAEKPVADPAQAFVGILDPFNSAQPQVQASLQAFQQQAKLLQQDTQTGVDMVLSRLPLGTPAQAGTVK